jgi:predicted double-glycine peptidase
MFLIMLMLFVVALAIVLAGLFLSLRSSAAVDDEPQIRRVSKVQRVRAHGYQTQPRSYSYGNRRYTSASGPGMVQVRSASSIAYLDTERQSTRNLFSALLDVKYLFNPQKGKQTPWLGLFLILLALFGIGLFTVRPTFDNASVMPLFGIDSPTSNSQKATTSTKSSSPAQPVFAGVVGASKALVRVGQLNHDQYNSTSEYNTWSDSVCSSAAMTEVINAYTTGHTYRVTDILAEEYKLHQITPEDGMLSPNGIDITVAAFGFNATHLNKPTLDQVISIANNGRPVIVSFPPGTWSSGGHILVVRGGNKGQVYLADSSIFNMTTMSRQTFMSYWRGYAVVVTPKK